MLKAGRMRGFTLMEVLIAITLIGILIALGAPSMTTYLQNSKVSSAAQTFHAALQLARTEAIRRNAPVEFVLTNSSVAASGVADSVTAAVAGRNWLVRAPIPPANTNFELIDAKSGQEGGGAAVHVEAAASSVTFNGFGGTADSSSYTLDLSAVAGACPGASSPGTCRRIQVSPGGKISSCDPAVAVSDSRHC